MTKETIDLVFSFDTTGSMAPCLTQVRRVVEETTKDLFDQIADLRIGIIAHGDYCDGPKVISTLDLTDDKRKICAFIKSAPETYGGDSDECYELVLNKVRSFGWTSGINKALVLIGDANPHAVGYRYGSTLNSLDWKNEAGLLIESGIKIYPVQALGRSGSNQFYARLAEMSGVPKLTLPQFADITDIICALCFQQAGQLSQFEERIKKRTKKPSYHVVQTLDVLAGRTLSPKSVTIGSRFQVLDVLTDCSIKEFVVDNGLIFKKGRGFYQFTKKETIQDYKEIVAQDEASGTIIDGDKARKALGIPNKNVDMSPKKSGYIGFIQSTSVNRRLKAGTKFLYEVAEGGLST